LACYSASGKVSLNELGRALGFPGKPDGMDGSEVDRYVQEGRLAEVAGYCETDVISTYRIWLVYELFRGTITKAEFDASEANNLLEFVGQRVAAKPYLAHVLQRGGGNESATPALITAGDVVIAVP
jgi:predicted PolB exonuclease-like 3'-5' exonuclease